VDVVIVPVLVYHAVATVSPSGLARWTVSPEKFAQHVDAIARSGRTPLTISELAECLRGERRLDGDAVAITFDDGYADTHDAAHTLMRRGIRSTVYVTTGPIGTPGMLSVAQLEQLAGTDAVELGAHSVTHAHLDELSPAGIEREIAGSRDALEAVIGGPVTSFAYPHGSYDRRVRAAVIEAGFGSAVAVKNALSHLKDDPYAIARVTVTAGTSAARIAEILRGEDVPVASPVERVRTRAFRTLRRARRQLRERTRAARR
jgi:peptidoglycan/xylan/chitin deacetylase (PgdA/CDA1 family)